MSNFGRMLTLLGALAIFSVLFFPLWQIQLTAPQYPEGLILLIYPGKLGGNVDIINGLNHYIGMKPLHAADFMEFTLLPYIIGFFSILLLITAIAGKRKLLNISFFLFLAFGIIAMIDFWKWEYNYGHNLNPDAAIIVPGMAYQPPLIGFKQLLNFGAYSIPHIGGWIFVSVGLILLFTVFLEWRSHKKLGRMNIPAPALLALFIPLFSSSCKAGPQPLVMGKDNCNFCKMTISDNRFGGEIITQKGKIYKFDDAQCVLSFLKSGQLDQTQVREIYFTDFTNGHSLVKSDQAFFLKSEKLKAPMGGDLTTFSSKDSLNAVLRAFNGSEHQWDQIYKP